MLSDMICQPVAEVISAHAGRKGGMETGHTPVTARLPNFWGRLLKHKVHAPI